MLTLVDLRGYTGDPLEKLPRAALDREAARASVREIVAAVRAGGDAAAIDAEATHGTRPRALRVPAAELEEARARCEPRLVEAIVVAAERVRAYHERQLAEERAPFWRAGERGAEVGEESRPLGRVGCYVPGGRAAYPSTVLMTALPARVAGVGEVAVCSPPGADGTVHPVTLAACAVAGVREVYALGGAQAIAALAYGTESIRRVDRIVGPGNLYVTLAKHEVAMDVGIDSFAGPTEVMVVADASAPAVWIAADLVAQAEHDPMATAILVTPSEELIAAVAEALEKECASSPRREDVESALRSHGRAVLVDDLDRAVAVADAFAPEHLELMTADADERAPLVRNAGAVFIGPLSPVALGDYIAGTNHVLPTAGSARFASSLRVADFFRSTAVVRFDRTGLEALAPALIELAEAEGLDGHARAIRVRLEDGR